MNLYTKEQIQQLKDLNVIQYFSTVLNSGFKRGTLRELDEKVADIYEQATSTKVSRNFSCKLCVFNLYRDAGKLYYDSELYYKQQAMKKAREAKQNKKDKE